MNLTEQLHTALDALYAAVNKGDNVAFEKAVTLTEAALAMYACQQQAAADALEHQTSL